MSMERHIFHFTPGQVAYLRAESERLGISMAEFLRRVLDSYRQQAT